MNNDELYEKFGVTPIQLEEWSAEYESDDWSHMRFGKMIQGRPRIAAEPLDSITVKIPHSRSIAMKKASVKCGITKSEFVRRAIDNELVALA